MRAALVTMLLSAAMLTSTGLRAADGQWATAGDCPACDHQGAQYVDDSSPCSGAFTGLLGRFCDPDRGERWALAAEGIALQRSTTRSQALFELAGTPVAEALNSKDMNFPVEYGPQLSAIRQLGCSPFAVEVAYFQVDGFDAHSDVPGLSAMVTDVNGPHFTVTDATARYTSAIYMGDVNLRWQPFEWLSLLSGFRMGQLNERYHAGGTGTFAGEAVSLDVSTTNHLYGFQLGADADVIDFGGPLKIKGICRAGAFGNFASQNNRRVDAGFTDESLGATVDSRVAFLGEAGVVLTYSITKHLAFRASYEAMWLEGVALAPEQISSSDYVGATARVNADGGVFYHGGGLGVEYRF
ncbi:MAG: hypothetical protein LLG00_11900 [Planctomycetaceae bacterium]|nr:hypothetical protein [Planctomycetaceae bacterium]